MRKIQADFYTKVDDRYNVVEVIGRTVIYTPEIKYRQEQSTGIKWYKDTYKPEYRRKLENDL